MTVSISQVNTSIENWQSVLTKLNLVINAISSDAITANLTANGSVTTGNAFVNGIFSSNTLACNILRGGNVQANGTLAIYATTISLGNSSVNTVANSTQITVSSLVLGNATVGFSANTTAILLNGTAYSNLDPYILIQSEGANVGTRPILNYIKGSDSVDFVIEDNANNNRVDITLSINATSVGISGSNTYIQFNDSGALGSSAGFTFNKDSLKLTVSNSVSLAMALFAQGRVDSIYANSATTSSVIIDSFPLADFRGAEYVLTIKDNTANAHQITKLLILQDGNTYLTEYGTIFSNGDLALFTANANSTYCKLNYIGATDNTSVKGIRKLVSI
jgi:hypothetical protein